MPETPADECLKLLGKVNKLVLKMSRSTLIRCKTCERAFTSTNPRRRYCSQACQKRDWRARRTGNE